jgi:hypothetical protein
VVDADAALTAAASNRGHLCALAFFAAGRLKSGGNARVLQRRPAGTLCGLLCTGEGAQVDFFATENAHPERRLRHAKNARWRRKEDHKECQAVFFG